MRKIKNTTKIGFEVAESAVQHTMPFFMPELKDETIEGVDSKKYQLKASLAPYIANALYARDKEVLENERLRTFATMARTLNDKQLAKMVKELGYKLTVE